MLLPMSRFLLWGSGLVLRSSAQRDEPEPPSDPGGIVRPASLLITLLIFERSSVVFATLSSGILPI